MGGKRHRLITHIVLHIMDGSLAGTDHWFAMSKAERAAAGGVASGSSAHYGVGKNGEIHQYVPDDKIAYHAGRIDNASVSLPWGNPNSYSIGIEHEGRGRDTTLPDALYEASAWLLRQLADKYHLVLDTGTVLLHREIFSRKTCPGHLDRDRLLAMANALGRAENG